MSDFGQRVAAWQAAFGRHDLPWQRTQDPYAVWVSEIMLQQTQVSSVLNYYPRFMARYPDVATLAAAPLDAVLGLWSGLGYYSRARHLKRAAELILERHGGQVPASAEALIALPGIGRSTAAAIRVFAFDLRDAILDGNVKRLLARYFALEGWPGEPKVERRLWSLAWETLPTTSVAPYTQGLMDLGATLCTRSRPRCDACPVAADCRALALRAVAAYPAARPRRAVPHKRTVAIVAVDADGRVLLERRPPSGIWGGLWSLPEVESVDDAAAACAERFGLAIEVDGPGSPIQHAFTHYKLEILPLHVRVVGSTRLLMEAAAVWVDRTALDEAPLPAPIRTLLAKQGD